MDGVIESGWYTWSSGISLWLVSTPLLALASSSSSPLSYYVPDGPSGGGLLSGAVVLSLPLVPVPIPSGATPVISW
jgi:hypothetical protein